MKDIKTRDTVKDIRTLDRAANMADRMKSAYIRTKEQTEQAQRADADSPVGYAEDRATEKAGDITREAGHKLHNQGKRFTEKTRQKIKERHTREYTPEPEQPEAKGEPQKAQHQKAPASKSPVSPHEPHTPDNISPNYTTHGRDFAQYDARRRVEQASSNYAGEKTRQGVRTVERSIKQNVRTSEKAIKTSARGSIKTAQRGVKTA